LDGELPDSILDVIGRHVVLGRLLLSSFDYFLVKSGQHLQHKAQQMAAILFTTLLFE
jgi:hypothetical protein